MEENSKTFNVIVHTKEHHTYVGVAWLLSDGAIHFMWAIKTTNPRLTLRYFSIRLEHIVSISNPSVNDETKAILYKHKMGA
jgi:hypothetical protein